MSKEKKEEETVSRRKYLKYVGAGVVVVAAAGAGGYYATKPKPTPTPKRKVIRWWQLIQSAKNLIFAQKAVAALFEKEHPDVTIEPAVFEYPVYQTSLLTAIEGGNPPELSTVNNVWMAQFAKAGYLEPLDDRIKEAGINKDEFFPGAWESCVFGGKTYGIPLDVGVWMFLYWNKDLFKKAGFDPEQPPRTWEELIDMGKSMRKTLPSDVHPMAAGAGLDAYTSVLHNCFLRTRGGELADRETLKATIKNQENYDALQFYKDIMEISQPGFLTQWEPETSLLFASEKAAMTFDGEWMTDTFNIKGPSNWDMSYVPIPGGERYGKGPGRAIGSFGGWNLVVYKDAKYKEEVWEFIQLLLKPENMWNIVTLTPSKIDVAKEFCEAKKKRPDVVLDMLSNSPPHCAFWSVKWTEISRIQHNMVQEVLSGRKSIEQASADASDAMDAILAKEPKE
jgi:multiple sugar transport system substrate-binding protein